MTRECYKMSIEEAMQAVKRIIAEGKDAEIRRGTGGSYIVYSLDKKRIERQDNDLGPE